MKEFQFFHKGIEFGKVELELINKPNRELSIYVISGPNSGKTYKGWDYFSILVDLRRDFEKEALLIGCVGSKRNFYPSRMCLDMGMGEIGYNLTLGKRGTRDSKVRTFDEYNVASELSTIEDQKAFFAEWKKSLKR